MFNTHTLYKSHWKYEFESHQHEPFVRIAYKETCEGQTFVVNLGRESKEYARIMYRKLLKDGFKKK
jgi:hypothetical protein